MNESDKNTALIRNLMLFMSLVMPDYKEAKKWLKENGVTIIQRMDLCE